MQELQALVAAMREVAVSLKSFIKDQPIAQEVIAEETYTSSAEFSDDFYSLLDSLKTAARAVGSKRGKLRRWLRKSDFANNTQADELFDVFLNKFHDAMVALRSADKQLQKKL